MDLIDTIILENIKNVKKNKKEFEEAVTEYKNS